jgi:hypothetical protein
MSYNMMIGYDIYDCFTMEHFPLPQRMTLMTKIYCSRLYMVSFLTYLIKVNDPSSEILLLKLTIE